MSELIIVNFRSAKAGFLAGLALARLQDQSRVAAEDIVVLTRNPDGKVSVSQSINKTTGLTLGGGRWGLLIGMMCLGKADAPNSGMTPRFREAGLEEAFLQDMLRSPPKAGSAVGMRVKSLGADRVASFLKAQPGAGKLIRTRLTGDVEDILVAMQAEIPETAMAHLNRSNG